MLGFGALELLAFLDHLGPKVFLIELEQQIVLRVHILEAPAYAAAEHAAFEELHVEGEDALRRQVVGNEAAALMNPEIAIFLPGGSVFELGHVAGLDDGALAGERDFDGARLAAGQLHALGAIGKAGSLG